MLKEVASNDNILNQLRHKITKGIENSSCKGESCMWMSVKGPRATEILGMVQGKFKEKRWG
jgi:hypothetical protein